jgi:hypothetical protein
MKKVLLILAFLFILVAIPLTVFLTRQRQEIRQQAAPATSLYFDPNDVTKNVNDTFDLPIKIDTGENTVGAVQIKLQYDAAYLEVLQFTKNDAAFPTELVNDIQDGSASITVSTLQQIGAGQHGSGITVVTAKFKAKAATGAGGTQITFAPGTKATSATNADIDTDLLVAKPPAKVTITAATGASPSPSPSGSAVPSPSAGSTSPTPSPSGVQVSPSATPGTGGGTASPTPSPSASSTPSSSPLPSASSSTGQTTTITSPTGGSTVTTRRPTITGKSFNNGLMVLSITGTSIATTFNADASGNWSYTVSSDLANGTYTVTVTGDNIGSGVPETATATFTVSVGTGGAAIATPSPAPSPTSSLAAGTGGTGTQSAVPVTADVTPTMFAIGLAVLLLGFGFVAILL